jgi:pimeloyl-ACP methyl ester carboxylesterase
MRTQLVETELHEVDVDGRTVRHRVIGSGEPLVLVHGLAGSWRWWSPLLQLLSERRRVYAVNLPRPGRRVEAAELSAWLARWLDAAGLERVDLVGHSLGGLVAAELAARAPERATRLVLVAPAGIPCGRNFIARALPLAGTLAAIRSWLPMAAADALRLGPLALSRGIVFVSKCDLTPELHSVRAPTLIVWGERDHLVPLWVAEQWQRELRSSRLALLDCGHVPMLEAPRELAASVLPFLEEELADDLGDEVGTRVVDGMRLARNDDQPAAR